MTDKELLNMVLKDNSFEKEAALSISEQISKELEKTAPDYNKISELSRNYADLIDTDEDIILRSEEHTQKILSAARKYSPKKRLFRRFLGIAASLVLITFSANCYTVAALNMNIFKAIVHFANKGFSVEFTSEEEINNDPYGIKAECVSGTLNGSENHAWTKVNIDGTWYYADAMWNLEPTISLPSNYQIVSTNPYK